MAVGYVVIGSAESTPLEEAAQWVQHPVAVTYSLSSYVHAKWHDQCAADGVDAAAASKEYSRRNTPAAPCGRYGATAVVYKQQMWLFGGTDGGFSKKGRDKSKPGKIACLPGTSLVRVLLLT